MKTGFHRAKDYFSFRSKLPCHRNDNRFGECIVHGRLCLPPLQVPYENTMIGAANPNKTRTILLAANRKTIAQTQRKTIETLTASRVLVREGRLDLPCGAGRLAALGCSRQPIHSYSGSTPVFAKRNQPPFRVTDSFWCTGTIQIRTHTVAKPNEVGLRRKRKNKVDGRCGGAYATT